MSRDAPELARRLARDAEAVCRHYLSNGRRQGRYGDLLDVIRESCGFIDLRDVAEEARRFLSLPRAEPRRTPKLVRTPVPAGSRWDTFSPSSGEKVGLPCQRPGLVSPPTGKCRLKMGPEPGPVAQCLSEIGRSPSWSICAQSNACGERK
jgi:hypothetical protein